MLVTDNNKCEFINEIHLILVGWGVVGQQHCVLRFLGPLEIYYCIERVSVAKYICH